MNDRVKHWLYGLGSSLIGGGAAAVTSGVTSIGISPDKFNFADMKGATHVLEMVGINFIVSGILSAMFYLRQSPLPTESTGNTEIIKKL